MRSVPLLTAAALFTLLAACSQVEAPPDTPAVSAPDTDATSPDPETPSTDAAAAHVVTMFDCEGTHITATFDGDAASVSADGRLLTLRTEPAASGAKYVDADGNVLWTRGPNDALLTLVGQPDRACIATAAPH